MCPSSTVASIDPVSGSKWECRDPCSQFEILSAYGACADRSLGGNTRSPISLSLRCIGRVVVGTTELLCVDCSCYVQVSCPLEDAGHAEGPDWVLGDGGGFGSKRVPRAVLLHPGHVCFLEL